MFAGGYLSALRGMSGTAGCGVLLDHATPDDWTVPDVLGDPRKGAAADVEDAALVAHFSGSGSADARVFHQSPSPSDVVTLGSLVRMILRGGPVQ